jgi:hypothetical protein
VLGKSALETLITPALFSHLPPDPRREKRERLVKATKTPLV